MVKINELVKPGDVIVTTENHFFYRVQDDTTEVKKMEWLEVFEWKRTAMLNAFNSARTR